MEKLIIKNFGPISDVEIELKKYIVLIGDTSTGKSVIAKLICIFQECLLIGVKDIKSFKDKLEKYNIPYLNENSIIEYHFFEEYYVKIHGDILLNNLQKENIIKNKNYQDGNLILSKGSISSYNFNQLQNISNLEELKNILPNYDQFSKIENELKKAKFGTPNYNNLKKQLADSHWYNFKLFNDISTYVNNLFKENTLIKINEFVSICENQYIRLSTPQLYFNNFSDKNITVLAFIITKINEKVPNEFSDSLSELNDFFKNGPALISNIMLGSTNVIDENDFIVRPIAIYYDLK